VSGKPQKRGSPKPRIHDPHRHRRRRHLRTLRRFTLEEHIRGRAEYTLYESSPRLGGVLRTEHIDGCVVEAGPDSFITEKPWAADLCRALGLGDQLIGSNDADRKTYILVHGRLIPMPDGLMFLVPTKILPTGSRRFFPGAPSSAWRRKCSTLPTPPTETKA
jgi:protoporphyrinogen oxidase